MLEFFLTPTHLVWSPDLDDHDVLHCADISDAVRAELLDELQRKRRQLAERQAERPEAAA